MGFTSKHTGAQIEAYLDSVPNKQDKISDLDSIRSGAAKGATAIQEVKTINGQSIVGSGDITIEGGGGGGSIDESVIISNEKVAAAAMNDLNDKIKALPTNEVVDTKIADAVSEVNTSHDADVTAINTTYTNLKKELVNDEWVATMALNDLKAQIEDLINRVTALEGA